MNNFLVVSALLVVGCYACQRGTERSTMVVTVYDVKKEWTSANPTTTNDQLLQDVRRYMRHVITQEFPIQKWFADEIDQHVRTLRIEQVNDWRCEYYVSSLVEGKEKQNVCLLRNSVVDNRCTSVDANSVCTPGMIDNWKFEFDIENINKAGNDIYYEQFRRSLQKQFTDDGIQRAEISKK